MSNLLDMIKGQVTNELIGAAASKLGESEGGIMKALSGFAPTILAGLMNKSSDTGSMGTIFNLLSGAGDSNVLSNLSGLLGGQTSPEQESSSKMMDMLFGNKTSGIFDTISSMAGIKSSSASSLMSLAGPLVMGVLGKKIKSEGLNMGSFLNLLTSQKSSIMSALPAGMGSIMGLANMGDMPKVDMPSGGNKWLMPLLLIGAAAIGFFALKTCTKAPAVDTTAIEQTATDATAAVTETATEAATAVTGFVKELAGGFKIEGNMDGIEGKLITFVESANPVDDKTWFTFDRLTFKTGSAEVDMENSLPQLTNIVEILKAYPKVKLKVGGYTDNTGNKDANMKLSDNRAKAVVAELMKMGVPAGRLKPEGYGDAHPVASNDTEEGRAQNRRIDVRVTEK